jgi:hypothetical protein
MVGIVESWCRARESRDVELPLRRGELTDQSDEVMAVFGAAGSAPLGDEVVLILPL